MCSSKAGIMATYYKNMIYKFWLSASGVTFTSLADRKITSMLARLGLISVLKTILNPLPIFKVGN
jgi:hypothetical protein